MSNKSETGFTCPKCRNTKYFIASTVILNGETYISPQGWDYIVGDNDVDLHPEAFIKCDECGYEDYHVKFLED